MAWNSSKCQTKPTIAQTRTSHQPKIKTTTNDNTIRQKNSAQTHNAQVVHYHIKLDTS